MARRIGWIAIDADPVKNRDAGKVFKATEMDPFRSEKWAIRCFLALARGGIEIPEDIAKSGLQGIANYGMKIFGSMKPEDAEPLLDEMMTCVEAVPDPKNRGLTTELFPGSVEEMSTIWKLRKAVFGLHVDFSQLGTLYASAVASSKTASSPNT